MMRSTAMLATIAMASMVGMGAPHLAHDLFTAPPTRKRRFRNNGKQKTKAFNLRVEKRRAKNKQARRSRKGNR